MDTSVDIALTDKLASLRTMAPEWMEMPLAELEARNYRKVCSLVDSSLHPWKGAEIGFMQGSIDMWAVPVVVPMPGAGRAMVYMARDEWYFSGLEAGALLIGDDKTLSIGRVFDDRVALDGSGATGSVPVQSVFEARETCRLLYGTGELGACMFEFWMHFYLGEIAEEHKQWYRDGQLVRTMAHRAHKLYALYRRFVQGVPVLTCATEACGASPEVPVNGLAAAGIAQIPVENGFSSPYDDPVAFPPGGFDSTGWRMANGYA